MTGSLLRRAAAIVVALVGVVTPSVVAPAATASAGPHTPIERVSGNRCGSAEFTNTNRNDGSYNDNGNVYFSWEPPDSGCGNWGEPYGPVLEWKGERFGEPFGWETLRIGEYSMYPGLNATGYNNVRFRVCHMNWNTAFIGTCGGS
jgi:hypothetical protein